MVIADPAAKHITPRCGGKLIARSARHAGLGVHGGGDLCLVAIGFSHPAHDGLISQLGVELDARGNMLAKTFATSREGVYAAGDARIGQRR